MKNFFKFSILVVMTSLPTIFSSCSDNDDEPNNGGHHDWASAIVYFKNVPANLMAGPTSYGENLYYGAPDQITTGLIEPVSAFYVQFPVNYGLTYDENFNEVWGYSFYNGGIAVSNWHDMEEGSFLNQLSVYNKTSPSGGNFLIAYGSSSITDPNNAVYSDFAGCAHIYLTDEEGYTVKNPGNPDTAVSGNGPIYPETYFSSIAVANTTYAYKTMTEGNNYASALNKNNKGWFKVQFIAFDNDDPQAKPVGFVEAYLANFDTNLNRTAGFGEKVRDDWFRVDLSSLPVATILVVNFVGSDMGEFGLNTPTYCALDEIAVVYW